MLTLLALFGRAIIRLYDDWFVAYAAAKHLGWLWGDAVYNQRGRHVGWFDGSTLRDKAGRIVATNHGSIYPGMASVPRQPSRPALGSVSSRSAYSNSWSDTDYQQLFAP